MRVPATLLLLCTLLIASTARAGHELSFAHVDEIDGVSSRGFVYSWMYPAHFEFLRRYGIQSELLVGGIDGRREFAGDNGKDVYFAGLGMRLTRGRFFLGSATTLISRESEQLSSRYQFVTTVGVHLGRFVLSVRHLSNANTGGRNRGENLISLGYGW